MTKPKKGNQKSNQTIYMNNQNQNNSTDQQQDQSQKQPIINPNPNLSDNQNQNYMPNENQNLVPNQTKVFIQNKNQSIIPTLPPKLSDKSAQSLFQIEHQSLMSYQPQNLLNNPAQGIIKNPPLNIILNQTQPPKPVNQQNNNIQNPTKNKPVEEPTNLSQKQNQKSKEDKNKKHSNFQNYTNCKNHNHNSYYISTEDVNMIEENSSIKDNNTFLQEEVLIDKQLLKLKIAEEYTNDMLGRALSKAEHYASRCGKQSIENKLFNYYNRFDNGFNKEKDNLIKSLINALDTLQDYYEEDIKNKNKKFPSNLKQKDIIEYIKYLKNNCQDDDTNKKYFDAFINIIQGQKVNFGTFINTQNAKVDPNILVSSGISSMKYVRRQEKEWKEKAKEKGDYPVLLKVGMDWNINKHIPDDMKYDEDYS